MSKTDGDNLTFDEAGASTDFTIEDQGDIEMSITRLKGPEQPFTLEELRGVPGAPAFAIPTSVSFWRRLWVVVSAVPRYLISGSVEVP